MRRAFVIPPLLATLLIMPASAQSPLSFGEPLAVSAADRTALSPDIALGADGGLHVLYVEKLANANAAGGARDHAAGDDLYYRRALPGLSSLGPPVRVNSTAGEIWGFAVSKPELSVGGDGTLHVFYPGNALQADTGKNILVARYTRSTDGGRNFEAARTLNTAAANDLSEVMHGGFAAAHAFGTVVAAGESGVHAFWIDTRFMTEKDTAGAIFAASSNDAGRTFQPDRVIQRADACPCCQLAASALGNRVWLASRQAYAGGSRDGAVAASEDAGRSYGRPVRVGEGRWQIEGCPLKRTVVAARGNHVYTAWFTAGQESAGVYFSMSLDGGQTYQPSMALHPQAAVSDAPAIAIAPGGPIVVAWHGKTGGERRVFLRVSRNDGASFGNIVELPAPAGTAAYPEVVLMPNGNGGYIAWQQGQSAMVVRFAVDELTGPSARR